MLGWELPPHNSGGLGIACYQLCKALAKKGADIEFVLPYTAEHNVDFMKINAAHPQDAEAVLKSGIAYDSFRYVFKDGSVNYLNMFDQARVYEEAVGRIVKLAEFDVIHAHDWLTCRAALRAKMLTGKPLITHFHSIESDRAGHHFGGNPAVREIESLAANLSDRVIAVSQFTKDTLVREYGTPPDKIDVVYNHADPSELLNFNHADTSVSSGPSDENVYQYLEFMRRFGYRTVVYVGRLTIQKGVPNLLTAFKEVVARAPRTFLLLVGDGDQKFELINQAADLGIGGNVFFTGFLRGKRWRDAFVAADLFVLPSISEPFGLVALEAIGYGTPVLITKQAGVGEIIKNCLKVDFWDTNAMANNITAVVKNDALRDELHANSYNEYRNHSWDKSADRLWDVYSTQAKRALA
jgi:glycosyltransferase involved in cell wall biosynthesis